MPIGELLVPELLTGVHVESEHVVIDRHAKELSLVDRCGASIDSRAANLRLQLHRCTAYLPAGFHVYSECPLTVDYIHDAVVHGRRRQLTQLIHQTCVPDRYQPIDVRAVDLFERAIALSVVSHALGEDVVGVLAIVDQLARGLGDAQFGPHS